MQYARRSVRFFTSSATVPAARRGGLKKSVYITRWTPTTVAQAVCGTRCSGEECKSPWWATCLSPARLSHRLSHVTLSSQKCQSGESLTSTHWWWTPFFLSLRCRGNGYSSATLTNRERVIRESDPLSHRSPPMPPSLRPSTRDTYVVCAREGRGAPTHRTMWTSRRRRA